MDSLQIISAFGLSLKGLLTYFNSQSMLVKTVVTIAGILMLLWIKRRVSEVKTDLNRVISNTQSQKIQEKIDAKFSKSSLPSNRVLSYWLSISNEIASKWDDKHVITETVLYLKYGYTELYESSWSRQPRLAVTYYSELKDLSASTWIPVSQYGDGLSISDPITKNAEQPFFIKYKNWQKAVSKSHKIVSETVGDNFKVQISTNSKYMTIVYWYTYGKVKKNETFSFDGKVLINEKSSKVFNIELTS